VRGHVLNPATGWPADALRQAGHPLEAVGHYQNAIAAPRITDVLPLLAKIGRCYLEASELELALTQFDSISAQTTDPGTRASMNLLAGETLEGLGDFEGAVSRYMDSVTNYPTAYDSYIALIRLVEAGIPVDEFQRGLVDYHAGAFEPAVAAFDRVLGSVPSAAGFYYRGLSHLALGNSQQALSDFEMVVTNFPDDALWPDSALAKARTQWAYLDQYSAAVDTYLALAAARPEPGVGSEALFAAGRTAERPITHATTIAAPALDVTSTSDPPGWSRAMPGRYQSVKACQFPRTSRTAAAESTIVRIVSRSTNPRKTPGVPKLM